MQSTLRTTLAAGLLLLPAAAALVSQPAAAQVAPAARPAIRGMTFNSDAGLRPGATLRLQVFAAPGARRVTVGLGDQVRVALREQAPGVYAGKHIIARAEHLDPLKLLHARVVYGNGTTSQDFRYPVAFQALAQAGRGPAQAHARDNRAPRVFAITPANGNRIGEYGRTVISARLSDDASGVNPNTVRLRVDGLDVTRDARIAPDQVGYAERLGRGRHTAEIVAADRAGNVSRVSWTFKVA